MLENVYWRQYPVNLLSDDKMACVEAMLPDNQKHIPYMVYIAALKLCDNDGIFDLDDGAVMARLTRVKDVSVIFNVINLMRQRHILYRVFDNAMLCGFVEWTYTDKKSVPIEERRRRVAERIKQEQARAGVNKDFTLPVQNQIAPMQPELYQEAETAPQAGVFLCPENDKKAENVVKAADDDKNAKNVETVQYSTVQNNNTVQETVQTNIQDSINTHTQQQATGSGLLESPPQVACQDTNAVGVKNIQNQNTETANTPTGGDASAGEVISSLAEKALQEARESVENSDTASLIGYLNDFFVKNCYGFKANQSAGAINTLAGKILELSDDVNPPGTVAGLLCSEFKKMCDGQRAEYWKRMPLLPANMIKDRAWYELVQYAGKILATNTNSEKFIQAAKKAQEECEAEKELISDAMREEYLKYNINPLDPNAQKLLLIAKSREAEAERERNAEIDAEAERKAEDEEFEIF